MTWQKLFGERATTRLAAVFDTAAAAETTADRIRSIAGLGPAQLRLLKPGDHQFDIKVEPEPGGVARTAIRTHVVFGAAGLVVGILLWFVLFQNEFGLVRAAPLTSAIASIFFLTTAGLMLGGLITLRPDHQLLITRLRAALKAGKWCVIIHPYSPAQCDKVEALLNEDGAETLRSV